MVPDYLERLRAALADRYDITRRIGEGGMAAVYLAVDRRHHRQVALKVMRPELGDALGADRFLREVEIAARLNHPHILPMHDSGEVDGILWYVMPFVEGESLAGRIARERTLPMADAVRLAREVADGLDYVSRIYVMAGQPAKAVETLQRMLKLPWHISGAWLRLDPFFAPLRDDPGFRRLSGS